MVFIGLGRVRSLQERPGLAPAGARRRVVLFLVAAADDVEAVEPADAVVVVVATEKRNDHESLECQRQVPAHHSGQVVGLAFETQPRPFDLLIVLELGLEELDELDRHAGGACNRNRGVAVGRIDLLHPLVGDDVAGCGAPVTCHDHAVGEGERQHGGRFGDLERGPRLLDRPFGAHPACLEQREKARSRDRFVEWE